ncbi:MAG: polysaccharide deacetylase family protein [Alphaproteobacteria bacterium]
MPLTIVTYHFVRDLKNSRYPAIKGRDLSEFKMQLDYFARNHELVTTADVVDAFEGGSTLPTNAAWLTFDDGYKDHYTNVLPALYERGMHGAFFPSVNAIAHGELLDVNKAHFIRAAESDPTPIIDEIRTFIEENQERDGILPFAAYWDEHAKPVRYDTAEIWFIKSVLQRALPEALRIILIDKLFQKFVSVDQKGFAAELYVSQDELRMMIQCGMYIGGHGAKHDRLDRLDDKGQQEEVTASLDFLRGLGAPTTNWVMCYPHGANDEKLRALLRRNGCAIGLTIDGGTVDAAKDDPLRLPRLDTIELPIT